MSLRKLIRGSETGLGGHPLFGWRLVSFDQTAQAGTHRGQVVFPTPLPRTCREFWIASLYLFFEVNAHSRHNFQILYDRASDAFGNLITVGVELLEGS